MASPRKNSAADKNGKTPKASSFRVSKEPVTRPKQEIDVHKYEATAAGGSVAPATAPAEDLGDLPTSYGAQTIFLIARDPHWIFTYWDIDPKEFAASNMLDGVRRVYLKVFGPAGAETMVEIVPEAKNWYLPVEQAGASYTVEIGYKDKRNRWKAIARSTEAATPSDHVADGGEGDFATVPFHLTFERLLEMVHATMSEGDSLIQALSRLQSDGRRLAIGGGGIPNWSEEQKRVLAALVGQELVDRIDMGSGDIDQLLRKELQSKLGSESASGLSLQGRLGELVGPGESSLFSAMGASWSAQPFSVKRERGFFMHVNAEVIFYGGTDPDAKVTIAGNEIKLSPDGTFRYHFKLPDGNFQIPIVAQSPDQVEERSATLSFERSTAKKGDVKATAQPETLGVPMGRTR